MLLVAWMPLATRYLDRPPVAHTGGFGEPSCHSCHFDGPLDDDAGSLAISGVPARYEPGRGYRLVVRLAHPQLEAGGFQLSVRYAGGAQRGQQAGALRAMDQRAEVTAVGEPRIEYARHLAAGTTPTGQREATWALEWTAPERPAGRIVFHAAANAANGDRSEFGDFIYLQEAGSEPAATAVRKQR